MRETTTIKENAALIIASTALEINHVVCDCDSILTNIISWSNHTDIADPEILAAAAIEYGKWTGELHLMIFSMLEISGFPQNILRIMLLMIFLFGKSKSLKWILSGGKINENV